MPEKRLLSADLLKYPIIIFSILLALIVLKFVLGLELGAVTELSTEGVKFAEQSRSTVTALAELEARLEELAQRTEVLEESAQTGSSTRSSPLPEAYAASETVSDATAEVSRIADEMLQHKAKQLRGYILIGSYDGQWHEQQLARLDTGQPVDAPPKQILSGTEYRVRSNMVVRSGVPVGEATLTRDRRDIGVAARGSRVRVLQSPVRVDRGGDVQYWAEIEVVAESAAD
jgi:hypothetical protein